MRLPRSDTLGVFFRGRSAMPRSRSSGAARDSPSWVISELANLGVGVLGAVKTPSSQG